MVITRKGEVYSCHRGGKGIREKPAIRGPSGAASDDSFQERLWGRGKRNLGGGGGRTYTEVT